MIGIHLLGNGVKVDESLGQVNTSVVKIIQVISVIFQLKHVSSLNNNAC